MRDDNDIDIEEQRPIFPRQAVEQNNVGSLLRIYRFFKNYPGHSILIKIGITTAIFTPPSVVFSKFTDDFTMISLVTLGSAVVSSGITFGTAGILSCLFEKRESQLITEAAAQREAARRDAILRRPVSSARAVLLCRKQGGNVFSGFPISLVHKIIGEIDPRLKRKMEIAKIPGIVELKHPSRQRKGSHA